jgi:hypothetical protein
MAEYCKITANCYQPLLAVLQVHICHYDSQARNLTVTSVVLYPVPAVTTATATAGDTAAASATAGATTAAAAAGTAAPNATVASRITQSVNGDAPHTGSSSGSPQCHVKLGEHIPECIGISTPEEGGLMFFDKVSCCAFHRFLCGHCANTIIVACEVYCDYSYRESSERSICAMQLCRGVTVVLSAA